MLNDQENRTISAKLLNFSHSVDNLWNVTTALGKHPSTKTAFKQFLMSLGFSGLLANIMNKSPGIFAYSDLIRTLIKFEPDSLTAVVKIVGSLYADCDPTKIVSQINQYLNQRLFLKDLFRDRKDPIDLYA